MKHLEAAKRQNKKPSLLRVLVSTFWPEYLYLGVIDACMDLGLRIAQPIMLGYLLDSFSSGVITTDAFYYAGAVVGINAMSAMLINQFIMNAFHYGMKVRAACCALIYRKVKYNCCFLFKSKILLNFAIILSNNYILGIKIKQNSLGRDSIR